MRTRRRRRTKRDPDPERDHEPPIRAGRRRVANAESGALPLTSRSAVRRRAYFVGIILALALLVVFQAAISAQGGNPTEPANSPATDTLPILRAIVIIFLLVVATFFFVLAETALLTVRRSRIDQLVEEGNRSARLAAALLAEPTRMLATLQVWLTLVTMAAGGAAEQNLSGPLKSLLVTHFPNTVVAHSAGWISIVVVLLCAALPMLVVGEITPKSLAIRHSERIALFAVYPIRWLEFIAKPFVWLVTKLSNAITRTFFGVTATFHTSAMSKEEMKLMVEVSEEHGQIETEEKEMIHNVFELGDTVVRKVMTPRPDITAVEADVSVDEMIRTVTSSGHSRLPVYDDDEDNVIGIIHVKDLLNAVTGETPPKSIRELMREPYFVPENKRVDDLLRELRRSKIQMAIVRDEYGTVTGVVTIEDILEEIVGEIQDEYDTEEEPEVNCIDDRTSIVDGGMKLEDFNERMGVELPSEEADTLGGFVFGLLGHQPSKGETAPWDGLEFTVEATDGKRIQKVRVVRSVVEQQVAEGGEYSGENGE